jgi:hypothetical protein
MSAPDQDDLQFESAVPSQAGAAGQALGNGPACGSCGQPIEVYYYEAAGQSICRKCKGTLEMAQGGGGGATRGMLGAVALGGLAALLGAAIYLGIAFGTGYEVGLIAVLVGFLVGKGVFVGSGRQGGRRYQVLATVLTYFAISVTYVPQMLMQVMEETTVSATDAATEAAAGVATGAAAGASAVESAPSTDGGAVEGTALIGGGVGAIVGLAGFMLLVAPVKVILSDFPGSVISLIIIGVGLMQAWQGAKRQAVEIKGPFKLADQANGMATGTA